MHSLAVIIIQLRTSKTMTMRFVLVLCFVITAAIAEDKYDEKYDHIEVKEVIGNKRLLQSYIECLLEKGKCTPEGKALKDHLGEALATGCEKCTEKQKQGAQTVLEHLIKNEPESWKALCEKYDPEGTFRKKYESLAKEHGITIPE